MGGGTHLGCPSYELALNTRVCVCVCDFAVGSFNDECRTLYIAGLRRIRDVNIEKLLKQNFGEWGEIENINVIYRLNIAFVRCVFTAYVCAVCAHMLLDAQVSLSCEC